MTGRLLLILFGILLSCNDTAFGQLYGTNVFEFQYGSLSYEENTYLTTSYDQLNLYYDQGKISVYGRFEHFLTPFNERNYFSLTQKRLQYEDDHFKLRVGDFYQTIGRGLLLRSYEIPGSVFEDSFYRTRYAFNRDQEGISLGYKNDWFEAFVIHARPLFNPLPPNFKPDSARRPDLVEAIESNFYLTEDLSIGGAFMRSRTDGQDEYRKLASLMYNYNLPFDLQIYGEYAFDTDVAFFRFEKEDSYALYSGLNYFYESFGLSFEYKNYNRFRLGSGYNDPPSLIKEHNYPVLNRSTHVLSTANESGFQFEAFYSFENAHSITANITTARNEVFRTKKYREYFLEGYYQASDFLSFKSFFDYATDERKGEEDRISVGLITDKSFNYEWNLALDIQFQTYYKTAFSQNVENYYASIAYSSVPDFTIGLVFEATDDLLLTDNPRTFEVEDELRTWLGGNVRYMINQTNTLDVFAGKRRGGPACTSGICYEILDFEGVELRFTTRF